jgi:excisionase family DNA binding protein
MTDSFNPDEWISQKQAAEIREVTRQAIYELVQKGRFETLEVGGKTLLKREDVKNYKSKKGGRPPKDSSSGSSSKEH